MEELGELLKTTRENTGINLEEVSKDLGIEEIVLKNIEDGKIGAFKDVFLLKQNISDYSKYLGLDSEKLLDNFNEYLFEYTSKIPIKEIEKKIVENNKDSLGKEVVSPYSLDKPVNRNKLYALIYILIFILVILAIFWSVNQITVEKKNAYIIGYRK